MAAPIISHMARGCSYNSRPAHVTLVDIQQMVISPGTINYENKDDHDHDDDGDHDHDDDDEENYDVTISDIDQMVFSPSECRSSCQLSTPRRCTRFQIGLYLKRFNRWLEKWNLQKAKSENDFPQIPSQIYLQMVYDEFLWSLTTVHTVHTVRR